MDIARLLTAEHITELSMCHIPAIIKMMERGRDEANVVREACGGLLYLACHNDNRKTIAKMGGIKVILDGMKRHVEDAGIQGAGSALLLNLIGPDNDNEKTITKMGGIKVILDGMRMHESDADNQRIGCNALAHLALDNLDNARSIAEMGGIKVVLDAMKRYESNAGVQTSGCAALCTLMKSYESNAGVQTYGCGALCTFNLSHDIRKTIVKLGGIKVILDAMKRHESNADIQ